MHNKITVSINSTEHKFVIYKAWQKKPNYPIQQRAKQNIAQLYCKILTCTSQDRHFR